MSRSATVNAVRFFPDGLMVAATSNTKKLFVLDVETGKEVVQYDNCKVPLGPLVASGVLDGFFSLIFFVWRFCVYFSRCVQRARSHCSGNARLQGGNTVRSV